MELVNIKNPKKKSYTGPGGYIVEMVAFKALKAKIDVGLYDIKIPKGKSSDAHHHDEQDEIFYFLDPVTIIINGKRHELKANTAVYCAPKEVHEIKAEKNNVRYIVIRFPFNQQDKTLAKFGGGKP